MLSESPGSVQAIGIIPIPPTVDHAQYNRGHDNIKPASSNDIRTRKMSNCTSLFKEPVDCDGSLEKGRPMLS